MSGTGECFSAPSGVWRSLAVSGDEAMEAVLVTAGDARKHPVWAPEIIRAAMALGVGLDHSGYVAPLGLLPPTTRQAVTEMMMQQAAE